jgi:excisionase family DNA binding protein
MRTPSSGSIRFKLGELITVEDLAAKLQVSLKTVRHWIYLRKIPFTKFGRRVYFSIGVVEHMLRQNVVPAFSRQHGPDTGPVRNPIPTQAREGGLNESTEVTNG